LYQVKGAPESLVNVCTTTTIPTNYTMELRGLTFSGYRVLACGIKPLLPSDYRLPRSDLEKDLTFVGLLNMENQLKQETRKYLNHYLACGFRMVMITGDNPLTAAAVAKMSGAFVSSHHDNRQTYVLDAEVGGSRRMVEEED